MEIRKENIERIFKVLQLQGVNTKMPFLYGYFFIDKSKTKLNHFKTLLVEKGYLFVSNSECEDGNFILHIEKEETHSISSLIDQLTTFNKLAEKYSVECFDGWDMGSTDKTKPIISDEDFLKILSSKRVEEVFNLGIELLENNIFDKSILAFEKCIEENFDVENSLYKQFICFDYLEEYQRAIFNLKEILKVNPNHFKACFNIAALSYYLEDYSTSLKFYQKANEIEKNNDDVFYGIAASNFCMGDIESAKENCEIALRLNPNNENAKELSLFIVQ
ncbi:ribonuclease E inhibitor RraB [Pasteurella atlantica]|uniref:ribonuclease E inhibitor RraB n=1 Tax=Pasteurellaceae TaxID=712 RepID=UPI00276D6B38|nr:ribonuclease E inhibitor RraB [Pasteurella atlantica]MDP8032947.1 ribonuclease E inhibitor RraB [Pasteurella atlantica]MDP8034896.1 ribonuclease E inhibitor RraB [Pasteurella atlantica]MDP8036834.1 ribonuclease E inhibitor RraB [Pasteurella atlantica]MDP8047193.1 ribonuclease E inhibitor RraB [Pasteurella atlantica]MDP8049297.1 ribonuclease E inhibitor RraB [Pasteurella atlantica]